MLSQLSYTPAKIDARKRFSSLRPARLFHTLGRVNIFFGPGLVRCRRRRRVSSLGFLDARILLTDPLYATKQPRMIELSSLHQADDLTAELLHHAGAITAQLADLHADPPLGCSPSEPSTTTVGCNAQQRGHGIRQRCASVGQSGLCSDRSFFGRFRAHTATRGPLCRSLVALLFRLFVFQTPSRYGTKAAKPATLPL